MTRRFVLTPMLVATLAWGGCTVDPDADKDTGPTETDSGFDGIPTPQVRITPEGAVTTDDLVLVIDNADPDATYLIQWTQDSAGRSDLKDVTTVPSVQTTKGEEWRVSVVAQKDGDESQQGNATLTIANAAPTGTVTIGPVDATSVDTLLAEAQATDADGDTVDVTWSWTKNGGNFSASGPQVGPTFTKRGDTFEATATFDDGDGGTSEAKASVTVKNAAPIIQSIDLEPDDPDTLTVLEARHTAADPDGDSNLVAVYEWYIQAADAPVPTTSSHTGSTLPADKTTRDDTIWFELQVSDGIDTAVEVSDSVVIANTPPQYDSISVVAEDDMGTPGATPNELATLRCVPVGWVDPDLDPETYVFAWQKNGVDITGADQETLTGDDFDRGDFISCSATPTDGTLGQGLTSLPVEILNAPPTLAQARLTPGLPRVDDEISLNLTDLVDPDDDKIELTVVWYKNAGSGPSVIAGANGTSLSGRFSAGDIITADVTPTDGRANGATVSASGVRVLNTAPQITGVTLVPDAPSSDDALRATATAVDPDGQALTFEFEWAIQGTGVVRTADGDDEDGDTLPADLTGRADVVTVTVRAHDGVTGSAPFTVGVTIGNALPTITGVTLTPDEAYENTILTCTPQGWDDADGDPEDYLYTWYVNGQEIGARTSTLGGGDFGRGDSVSCSATPRNGSSLGTPRTSTPVIIRNTAPIVTTAQLTNLSPASGDDVGVIVSGASDIDGDSVSFRYRWTVNDVDVSIEPILPSSAFGAGDEVQVHVTPFDGTDEGAEIHSDVAIGLNTDPVITSIAVSPLGPKTADDIVATAAATDDDGHDLTFTYRWLINGSVVGGVTGDTLSSAFTRKGDLIRVIVTVTDGNGGFDSDEPSGTIQVQNTLPQITGVAIDPTSATEATTLTCVPEGWSDPDATGGVDPESYTWQWTVNGFVAGFNTNTLTGSFFDKGDAVKCRARPIDPSGGGTQLESASVVVDNTPPTLSGATLSTTNVLEATVLSVIPGTVADIDDENELRLEVAWYIGGAFVNNEETLSGALFDKDDEIHATLTVYDDDGATDMATTDTVVVGNTPPRIVSVAIEPPGAAVSDDLTAVVVTDDVDGDDVTVTYTWLVGGINRQSGTSDTFTSDNTTSGDLVSVRVQPFDGDDFGGEVTSSEIEIDNGKPSYTGAEIAPTEVYEATTLTCTPTGFSDPDGDPEQQPEYRWKVNDVTRAATPTLTGTNFNKGDTIRCEVTPYDGKAYGDPVVSADVTVLNTPPSVTDVSLSKVSPRERDLIVVNTIGVSDPDGDPVDFEVTWFVNDVETATGLSLTGADFDKGDTIYAEVVFSDGEAEIMRTTNTATAINTVPRILELSVTPNEPRVTDDLVADVVVDDPDPADVATMTLTWVWSIDDVDVAGIDTATMPAGTAVKDEVVTVRVTPNDGQVDGPTAASTGIEIKNSPPVVGSVVIEPLPVTEATGATCVASDVTDADGDDTSVTYTWYIGPNLRGIGPSFSPAQYARGDQLTCRAAAFDNNITGTATASAPATVANALPTINRVVIAPPEPREEDYVTVDIVDAIDLDGVDTVLFDYVWQVNGATVSNDSGIDGTVFDRGDTIQVFVTPRDPFGSGPTVESDEVVVANTLPAIITGPTLSPTSPSTTTDVTVAVTVDDPDGTTPTVTYSFYVDDVLVQSSDSNVLSSDTFERDQVIRVEVTPSDDVGDGQTKTVSTNPVVNTPPTVPSVTMSPELPVVGFDDVVCALDGLSTDVDAGDTVSYEIEFFVDGSYIGPGSPVLTVVYDDNSATLLAASVRSSQEFSCRARATDGTTPSAWSDFAFNEATNPQRDCETWRLNGGSERGSGLYWLDEDGPSGPEAPYQAYCDMDTANGGWTRVLRTQGNNVYWGQNTYDIVTEDSYVGVTAAEGVYETFRRTRGFSRLLLKQVTGSQAGAFAEVSAGVTLQLSLLEILEFCRDEDVAPEDDTAFKDPNTVGHTAVSSGSTFDSTTLQIFPDTAGGSPTTAMYFFMCGVNWSDDNDVAYLSFSDSPGDENDWGDGWRGTDQAGTIWSFGNGDYWEFNNGHIGASTITTYAGPKFTVGTDSETYHPGTYELYVR